MHCVWIFITHILILYDAWYFYKDISTIFCTENVVLGWTKTKRMLYVVAKRFPVGFFKLSMFVLKQEIEISYVIKGNIPRKNYIVINIISWFADFMFLVIKHHNCGIKIFKWQNVRILVTDFKCFITRYQIVNSHPWHILRKISQIC